MYAMPQGFEEIALVGSSIEFQGLNCSWQDFIAMRTEFTWEGELWHHLGEWCQKEDILAQNRSWVKTSIDAFERALIEDVLYEEDRRRKNGEEVISKTILRSLRKLLLDPARSAILLKSARMAERRMSFDHWVEVIRFARRHANREVFTLLDRVFSSLEEFKAIVEDHFYSGFHTWEQVFPEINREGFVIRQITNSRDLEREGEEQHNCCRMYVKKMEDYIILSVKGERRYTVSFRRTNGKTYQLDQFKAKFNEQPLKEDYWKVLQIIEEHSSMIKVDLVIPAPGTEMIW
jgi:hypothetical protein